MCSEITYAPEGPTVQKVTRFADEQEKGTETSKEWKKDGKDDKMEELLRKVDADFLAMIKEAEDDESKQTEAAAGIENK